MAFGQNAPEIDFFLGRCPQATVTLAFGKTMSHIRAWSFSTRKSDETPSDPLA
jgi:hypothetical protein